MRIAVHDYSGHPFQYDLSRELAARQHQVLHLYSAGFQSPHGELGHTRNLAVRGVEIARPFEKHHYIRRWQQEREYGRAAAAMLESFSPDCVISANTPLDAQLRLHSWAHRRRVPFVFWLQDLYSVGISTLMQKRLGLAGKLVGARYAAIEARILRSSAHVISISEDFLPVLVRWGVPQQRITVIHNWAPIASLPQMPKVNEWSKERGYDRKRVAMYSGTIGLKHDPEVLLRLAQLSQADGLMVVVISEGPGANYLAAEATRRGLDNLHVLPFVHFSELPQALGTADVLLAILNDDAGLFSVPSKILSYLCAGKPIVAALPAGNLSARILERSGAAVLTAAGDSRQFCDATLSVVADPARSRAMGDAGRRYAEANFTTSEIADRFERILRTVVAAAG